VTTASAKINIRGQVVYLEATAKHWPQLLQSLPWQEWRYNPAYLRPETFREMQNTPGYEGNCEALEMWAEKHGIKDRWIWDAAVQTLMKSPAGSVPTTWLYNTTEFPTDPFAPVIGDWIPPYFPWSQFKKSATTIFNRKMEQYRRSRIKIWGSNRTAMAEHAAWTVLWQLGKSPELIQRWIRTNHHRSVSAANIQTRVHEFASSIGLTPRKNRAGRNPKI
jgi:hypothetical protein